jgi:hypothetical protein
LIGDEHGFIVDFPLWIDRNFIEALDLVVPEEVPPTANEQKYHQSQLNRITAI